MLYLQVNAMPLSALSKNWPSFEKKYKEAEIMSQTSSLHSDCVGMLTPLVACSTAVSECGEQPHMCHKEGRNWTSGRARILLPQKT